MRKQLDIGDHEFDMKILIINPNSSPEVTATISKQASEMDNISADVEVICIPGTPISIESYRDEAKAVEKIVDYVELHKDGYDGFIIACHTDVGVQQIREITDKPVIGIGEASMKIATMLGHSFTVLSLRDKVIPKKYDFVRLMGLESQCASVRPTGLSVAKTSDFNERIIALTESGRKAIEEDGAEVLVLGCAGMAGAAKALSRNLGVPVVDGVEAAVRLIELLVSCGFKTSKVRKYR